MPPQLDAELRQTIALRVQYLRDLGIFDLYRRDEPSAETAENVATLVTEETAAAQPSIEHSPPALHLADYQVEDSAITSKNLIPVAAVDHAAALQVIRRDIGDCKRCALAAGRNKIVYGDGNPNARLMFIGEGPGADEDAQGLPFVGKAGQLLNNMITAMGLRREDVYIANIVKCRPPQNRVPEPDEANTCSQFLFRQIDVIQPEIMVALGSTAATYLLGAKSSLSGLRGRLHQARGIRLIVTYHPAYLLRDPRQKKEAWADLQIAMAELGLHAPRR